MKQVKTTEQYTLPKFSEKLSSGEDEESINNGNDPKPTLEPKKDAKGWVEIIVIPLTIALMTCGIAFVQLYNSNTQAEVTRVAALEKSTAIRVAGQLSAKAERELKILDLVKEKMFSDNDKDKLIAINLLTALSPDLALKLAKVFKLNEPDNVKIVNAANVVAKMYGNKKVCESNFLGLEPICRNELVEIDPIK